MSDNRGPKVEPEYPHSHRSHGGVAHRNRHKRFKLADALSCSMCKSLPGKHPYKGHNSPKRSSTDKGKIKGRDQKPKKSQMQQKRGAGGTPVAQY